MRDEVRNVEIGVELTIEAAEKNESRIYEGDGVSPPGVRLVSCNRYFGPLMRLAIEESDIIHVFIIPTSQNVHLIFKRSSSMSPSRSRNRLVRRAHYQSALNRALRGIIDEVFHLEHVQIVHVLVFRVAATESYHLGLVQSHCCVETLRFERVNADYIRFMPSAGLQVQSPEIVQVRLSLSSQHNHEAVNKRSSVVSPLRGHI